MGIKILIKYSEQKLNVSKLGKPLQNQVELAGEDMNAEQLEVAQVEPEAELATGPPAVALHLTVRWLTSGRTETAEFLKFIDLTRWTDRRTAREMRFGSCFATESSTADSGVHIEVGERSGWL